MWVILDVFDVSRGTILGNNGLTLDLEAMKAKPSTSNDLLILWIP